MPKVLAISSFVAHGTVGLQAAGPALQALGHRVIALPSVVLSNHPGYGQFARQPVAPEVLEQMLSALDGNGALEGIGAILTGYLPERGHVDVASRAVSLVKRRSPQAVYICDPVFGDDPGGFYLPEATAAAIKARLLPMADLVTPNRFELSWLSNAPVDSAATATDAARRLGVATVIATSVPLGAGRHRHDADFGARDANPSQRQPRPCPARYRGLAGGPTCGLRSILRSGARRPRRRPRHSDGRHRPEPGRGRPRSLGPRTARAIGRREGNGVTRR